MKLYNSRYIGENMYQMVKTMHTVVDNRDLKVHCIGHSLGAQACGFLGKHLIANADRKTSKKLVSSLKNGHWTKIGSVNFTLKWFELH